ncbi:hypothetical protein NE236_35895 [Actinoallomurus purpureus]|uniref:hypothetical protein n=1 Tax=Actinoallomurus purpureus TaxID=478114 RepID=UPI002092A8B8|nr:hypothetical protein [Actinoallomurus purpureus]MCO6010361.1 hypothetical protein [Actinoallomurus purpureus]
MGKRNGLPDSTLRGDTLTGVTPGARAAGCTSGGAPVGFTGTATAGRMVVETVCSCGGRHSPAADPRAGADPGPAADSAARGGLVVVGPFASAGRLAQTWADPTTGTLGRGALSQARLFYAVTDGPEGRAVRFSTEPADVTGAGPAPWAAAVAAALAGQAVPMPLTPYEGVFQLACGTTLSTSGGRERLTLDELDLADLADQARRILGRPIDPREVVRRALRHALDEALSAAGGRGVLGDGGGLGAAALAAVDPARLCRLHVHLDVPVLDRRRGRLPADTQVVDGMDHWRRICDGHRVGAAEEGDPWPPVPELLRRTEWEAAPLLSGAGLVRLLTGDAGTPGRFLTGWRQLTMAAPFPALFGRPGWQAWRPPRTDEPATPHDHAHSPDGGLPGGWISPAVAEAGAAVTSAQTASHLLPVADDTTDAVPGAGALQAVLDLLERPPRALGDRRIDPVLVCAHPVVLGAAVLLARHGRLRVRRRDGYIQAAPLLHDLVPAGRRPGDVTPDERDGLLAAAFVTRRLAAPERRAALLAEVDGSPWIVHDRLRAVLADSTRVLADARALRRLCVTAACHPDLLATGGRS